MDFSLYVNHIYYIKAGIKIFFEVTLAYNII